MKRIYVIGAVIFVVVVGFFVYAQTAAGVAELNALKLLPQPELFTELYFNDYSTFAAKLPTTIQKGDTISFSFTIHNLEGKNMSYPYVVSIVDSTFAATTTIQSNTVSLDDGASTTVPVVYTFKSNTPSVAVYVTLPDQQESLHFFVPNKD